MGRCSGAFRLLEEDDEREPDRDEEDREEDDEELFLVEEVFFCVEEAMGSSFPDEKPKPSAEVDNSSNYMIPQIEENCKGEMGSFGGRENIMETTCVSCDP